jgi:hypothetical protein
MLRGPKDERKRQETEDVSAAGQVASAATFGNGGAASAKAHSADKRSEIARNAASAPRAIDY